ncbi:MAG: phosphoribosylglycinamide formyltransferase [Methanoregulaceae archaeon PtaU1.Bin059]|mgnify:FL=1|nr:MAG: phosphoribosylglycinamide formyltransferase [Methanoregulaceae archaeon PtaB.Bin152]OPY43065.1 MAG: phosphoribosylglycinamide formyltransferase [Methanoregulaceae archaeon PtaU1.Bin059]
MKRIAVLASGRGSNFQALIDAIRDGQIPAVCVGLVTDNPAAYAITRAREVGIPVRVVDYTLFPEKGAFESALLAEMKSLDADLFVLAGYMRILGPGIVREFSGRMINIHPALLPSFAGLHAQRQALEYGVKVSGCTVHFVDEGMDTGPIIVQACVPVLDSDDEERLADRILAEEHRCLPLAVRLYCEGRLALIGRRVVLDKAGPGA